LFVAMMPVVPVNHNEIHAATATVWHRIGNVPSRAGIVAPDPALLIDLAQQITYHRAILLAVCRA